MVVVCWDVPANERRNIDEGALSQLRSTDKGAVVRELW